MFGKYAVVRQIARKGGTGRGKLPNSHMGKGPNGEGVVGNRQSAIAEGAWYLVGL